MRWPLWPLLGMACLAAPAGVHAEVPAPSPRAPLSFPLGAHGGTVEARIAESSGACSVVMGGPRGPTLALPTCDGLASSVETVTSDGRRIAVLRVQTARGAFVAVVTGEATSPRLVFSGRTDFHGDPGERRRARVDVTAEGEGRSRVVVGHEREDLRACGDGDAFVVAGEIDARTGHLVETPIVAPSSAEVVRTTRTRTGSASRPLVPTVRFERTRDLAADGAPVADENPLALADGRADTRFLVSPSRRRIGGRALGRWMVGRYALRALEIVPRGPGGAPEEVPEAIVLHVEGHAPLRVDLPRDLAEGERLRVELAAPIVTRCLDVSIPGSPARGTHGFALAEVVALSDLDEGDGPRRLLGDLSSGGEEARAAAELLGRLGGPAAELLAHAYPDMVASEKRAALRALRTLAPSNEIARQTLLVALGDPDSEVARATLDVVLSLGALGRPILEARLSVGGLEVASPLARRFASDAGPPLLSALEAATTDAARARVRDALGEMASRAPDAFVATVASALASGGATADALAQLAVAGAVVPPARAPAAAAASRALLGDEPSFTARYLALRALARLPRDTWGEGAEAEVSRLAASASEWMLRAAAVVALRGSAPEVESPVVVAALADAYPRVRVAAVESVQLTEPRIVEVATLARRDAWPMVREAAVTVLAPAREARPIVIAATRDRSARVRARALRVLTQARDTSPEARDAVRHVLRAERERPEVAVEALRYVARTCAASLEGDVEGLLERSRQRSSDVDDPRADEAILALHALGSDAARRSLDRLRSDPILGPAIGRLEGRPAECSAVGGRATEN
ncbi:MAG: hypothetical protein U0230_07005 [Polyangiales bacterium]